MEDLDKVLNKENSEGQLQEAKAEISKSEIESSVTVFNGKVKINVPLSGTEDDITDATKERKSISKTLVNYTMGRTSDGNTISDQHLDAYLADNKSDIADFCIF